MSVSLHQSVLTVTWVSSHRGGNIAIKQSRSWKYNILYHTQPIFQPPRNNTPSPYHQPSCLTDINLKIGSLVLLLTSEVSEHARVPTRSAVCTVCISDEHPPFLLLGSNRGCRIPHRNTSTVSRIQLFILSVQLHPSIYFSAPPTSKFTGR